MFCGFHREKQNKGSVPVYLNVYDIAAINGYAYWVGLGVFHSGVQVHGIEYAFGAHENSSTGVFEVLPKQCPGFTFRKSILIGWTDMESVDLRNFIEKISQEYAGNTYHLITRNCNHFCNDVCTRLTGQSIPRWVNRLARFGLFCKCVLPAGMDVTRVGQITTESNTTAHDEEKKRFRCISNVGFLRSFSMHPRSSTSNGPTENMSHSSISNGRTENMPLSFGTKGPTENMPHSSVSNGPMRNMPRSSISNGPTENMHSSTKNMPRSSSMKGVSKQESCLDFVPLTSVRLDLA